MKEREYRPEPAVMPAVELPEDLYRLGEELAEHVHDVWAAGRFADGWTKGPRNDENKTHPCLVPYDELTEEEKEYDRRTSMETLKFIISKGYKITTGF